MIRNTMSSEYQRMRFDPDAAIITFSKAKPPHLADEDLWGPELMRLFGQAILEDRFENYNGICQWTVKLPGQNKEAALTELRSQGFNIKNDPGPAPQQHVSNDPGPAPQQHVSNDPGSVVGPSIR